jgi:surface carbohydrate biosynthesis protein
MKILLLYDNFVRDYRGLLLLKELLSARGHDVWLKATWDQPIKFAEVLGVDVIVVGQIAENATYKSGEFAKHNNIRLVVNSTEQVTVPERFETFITYNTTQLNDQIIDLQSVALKDLYDFIQAHPLISSENKKKYRYLGFPRLDLSLNESFRFIEHATFRNKYKIPENGRVYLFISSFLFDSAFDGVPQKDLDKWNFSEFKSRTDELLKITTEVLRRLLDNEVKENDILLIKKHPWDCSDFFERNFISKNSIVIGNDDYILPCLTNADFILHTYSTAAIEAWIMNKPSISITSENHKRTFILNHMNNEVTVTNYDDLKRAIDSYPPINPSIETLKLFGENLDGLATIRLADEIDKLSPNPNKTKFRISPYRNFKYRLRYWLFDNGFKRLKLDYIQKNTKKYDFYRWENERAVINKLYTKVFKKYAKEVFEKGV